MTVRWQGPPTGPPFSPSLLSGRADLCPSRPSLPICHCQRAVRPDWALWWAGQVLLIGQPRGGQGQGRQGQAPSVGLGGIVGLVYGSGGGQGGGKCCGCGSWGDHWRLSAPGDTSAFPTFRLHVHCPLSEWVTSCPTTR